MRGFRNLRTVVVCLLSSLLLGCGGGTKPPPDNPLPSLTSISPTSVTVGSAGFTLTVDGSACISSSVVRWNGANRATTFVSANQLTTTIPATDIASGGTPQVTVFNPAPGGGTSVAATFTINNPVPMLTAILPVTATASGAGFTLTLTGSEFVDGSVVRWNGVDLTTTFVSANKLQSAVPAADIAAAGTAQVTVFNPGPGGGLSISLTFTIAVSFPPGVTERVSVASDGAQGNLFSDQPSISADARYVAFSSSASNLVAGDTNGVPDVFVRDTCAGAAGCTPSTIRVSVASDGTQGNFISVKPIISADGRFVAYASESDNLVAGDTNGFDDLFVRDTCAGAAGCTPSTIMVSVASDGTQGNSFTGEYSVSADGRFVAYASDADNLVAGDTNGADDIFLRDTCFGATGCTPSTIRVSVADDGTQGDSFSGLPSISADGRFVAFISSAGTLVAGDTNLTRDVFVRDTCAEAVGCTPSTIRVSVASDGTQADIFSTEPSISADGRFVAFTSGASNLVPGTITIELDVFVRDTCQGAPVGCTPSTILVSVADDGTHGNLFSEQPSISADGRFVAFMSGADNLVPNDTNGQIDEFIGLDVFVRDTCAGATGCTPSTIRVSVAGDGTQSDFLSLVPDLALDGRLVLFSSDATNLVTGDTNAARDVFLARTGH